MKLAKNLSKLRKGIKLLKKLLLTPTKMNIKKIISKKIMIKLLKNKEKKKKQTQRIGLQKGKLSLQF